MSQATPKPIVYFASVYSNYAMDYFI